MAPASETFRAASRSLASIFAIAGAVTVAGCSSVGGSAIRTGPVQMPTYAGPVAIYPMGQPPAGAVDLGVVEVHAAQQEATIDTLLPQFVRKVAQIGGNVALIEGVRARFDLAGRSQVETFYYTCSMGSTCAGTRVYSTNDEIMVVSMFGRAMTTARASDADAPLIPPGPPPPPDTSPLIPEPAEATSPDVEPEAPATPATPKPEGGPGTHRDLGAER